MSIVGRQSKEQTITRKLAIHEEEYVEHTRINCLMQCKVKNIQKIKYRNCLFTRKTQQLGKKDSKQSRKHTWFHNTMQFQKGKLYFMTYLSNCCTKRKKEEKKKDIENTQFA